MIIAWLSDVDETKHSELTTSCFCLCVCRFLSRAVLITDGSVLPIDSDQQVNHVSLIPKINSRTNSGRVGSDSGSQPFRNALNFVLHQRMIWFTLMLKKCWKRSETESHRKRQVKSNKKSPLLQKEKIPKFISVWTHTGTHTPSLIRCELNIEILN